MTDRGSVQLHAADVHYIWAELNPEGALIISGQDTRPGVRLGGVRTRLEHATSSGPVANERGPAAPPKFCGGCKRGSR